MGYGAFVTVTNETSQAVLLTISNVYCMYDNGEEGSWLSYFNNLTLQAGATYPNTPNGVYIEVKDGDYCTIHTSTFNMQIGEIGAIAFSERHDGYSSSPPTGVTVTIDNSGAQAKIAITIAG